MSREGMLDDKRPIERIVVGGDLPTGERREYVVGGYIGKPGMVTRIECYGEPGDGAYVPMFAVYQRADKLPSVRINGRYVVSVEYEDAS